MGPTAVLSTMVKVDGVKTAISQLASLDAAGKKAGAGIDAAAAKHQKGAQVIAKSAKVGVIAVGALAAGAVKVAADYESSMNTLQAVTGATDKEMGKLGKTAIKLGADVKLPGTSAADAAVAMTELAKGGLSVTDTMKAARGVLQLSAAAQIDNATAAQITVKALGAFELGGKQAVRVADLLAATSIASTAEITDVAAALQQAGASAHQLGIPIEDLTTAIGLMANAGIDGSDAGTSLKTMFSRLVPETDKQAAAMKRFGIDVFDANGKFVGVRETIERYRKALGGLTQEQQAAALKTLFGSDAQRAANIVLLGGVKAFDDMKEAATKQGAASDLAAAKMKGFKGSLEAFKSTLETLGVTFGTTLLPPLTAFMGALSSGFGALGQHKTATMALVGAIGTLGLTVLTVNGLMKAFAATTAAAAVVAGGAAGAFNALSFALFAIKYALVTNPFVAAILGLTALGAALVIAYQRSETFRNVVTAAIGAFVAFHVAHFRVAVAAVTGFVAAVTAAFSAVASQAGTLLFVFKAQFVPMVAVVAAAWSVISAITAAVWPTVRAVVTTAVTAISAMIRAHFVVYRAIVTTAWNAVRAVTVTAWNAIRAVVVAALAAIRAVVGQRIAAVQAVVSAGWSAVRAVTVAAWGAIRAVVSGAWAAVRAVTSAAWAAITGAVRAGAAAVRGVVRALASAIVAAFNALPGSLTGIGAAMIQGLIGGIKSMAGAAVSAAKGVVNDVKNAVTGFLGIGSPSKVFFEIGRNINQGLIGGLVSNKAGVAAAARSGLLFPLEAAIDKLSAKRDALQASFERVDQQGRLFALRKKAMGGDKDAGKELAQLRQEIARTKAVARIDVQITGIEKAKAMRDAFVSLASTLKDKVADAVAKFRDEWNKTKGIAFDAATDQLLANTPAAQELAALRAAQDSAEKTAEDKRLADKLTAARASGDAIAILEAQAEIDTVSRQRRIADLEAAVAAERTRIQEQRAAERQALEDAEAARFEAHLAKQLDAEFKQLQKRKQSYAKFVKDVQKLLAPLGIVFEASPGDQQAILLAGKAKKAKGMASGGSVLHGGWAVVGERGPELAHFPTGASVHSNQESRGLRDLLASEGSGVTFNQTNNMLQPGSPDVMRKVAAAAAAGFGLEGFIGSPRHATGL